MKRFLLPVLLLAFYATIAQNNALQIIPQPVDVKLTGGVFTLAKNSTICYNNPDGQKVAGMLAWKLDTPTGFAIQPIQGDKGTIQLTINAKADPLIGNEGYYLESSRKGVLIRANKPAGLYYGIQTLLQLFPAEIESRKVTMAKWILPAVKITDYPRFAWRGMMLDVSRHFFSKQDVEEYIDQISRYKYNTFHWHLSDDNGWRIEIKSLPRLTEVGAWRVPRAGHFGDRFDPKPGEAATDGGFYTQDDIREVIRYAADRNVTIMPEIDIPGHSMALIAAYPELSCKKDSSTKVNPGTRFSEWYGNGTFEMLKENTLNPSDEKVYEVLDKIFTEVAALFPNPYIHVGGDECYKGYWKADPGCQDLMKKLQIRHVEDLQGYFMLRVEKILKSKGKKLIGWDEILEGGISPDATVMSWRGTRGGTEAAQLGHDVVMTPSTFAYLDYVQGDPSIEPPIYASLRINKCYSFEPVPDGVDPKYILGGQGNLWTEQVPTLRYADYMIFPRAWALSEVYWSPKQLKNWDNFAGRMEAHFNRADAADMNYSKAVYDAIIHITSKADKISIAMETEIPGIDIYYSIDETMPDNHSVKYTQSFELPQGPLTLRAITYRNGKPLGHLITLRPEDLKNREVKLP